MLGSNPRPACQRVCGFGQAVSLFLLQNDAPRVVERTPRSQYLQCSAWCLAHGKHSGSSAIISPQTPDTWAHTTVVCAYDLRALTGTTLGCISPERMAFPSKAREIISLS